MNGSYCSLLTSARRRYGRLASLSILLAAGLTACDEPITEPSMPEALEATRQGSGASVMSAAGRPVPDQYIVVLKDNVAAADVPGLARRLAAAHRANLRHTYKSALKGFAVHLPAQAAAALAREPHVAYVEQDQELRLEHQGSSIGQVSFGTLGKTIQYDLPWGLDRIDQRQLPLSGTFWSTAYATLQNPVNVYIVDNGIETSHPDFGGRATFAYDAVSGGSHVCSWEESGGWSGDAHGTAVAGIVGGSRYGVAKGARLYDVRVVACGMTGPSSSDLMAGLDWVSLHHVKPAVVNLSMAADGQSPSLSYAVSKLAKSGVFVAAGAGNENEDACGHWPGGAPGVATVAAADRTDTRWSGSDWGRCVTLYAPYDVMTTWIGGRTGVFGGTSAATPHVAGVAALYKATYGDAPNQQILDWMISTATRDVIKDNVAGTPNRLLHSVTTFQDNIHVFNAAFYLQQYPDLKAAYGTNHAAARDHWLRVGLPVEGRRGSREFDVRFYLDQYPDLKSVYGTDYLLALQHWLETGLRPDGRRGSREFDVQWYLQQYPDLRAAYGTNYVMAFDHWMSRGLPVEGRRGSREFDVQWYLQQYPDIKSAYGTNYQAALDHWIRGGLPVEGRRGSREVDIRFYINQISDLKIVYTNYAAALDHWIHRGLPVEGRRASVEFDVRYYLATYGDIRAAYGANNFHAAFDHWVRAGIPEGRSGAPPRLAVK
jgi:subtilase family protein/peptidase inhibitor I9